MAFDIGPKIGIEGEKEFKEAMKSIDSSLKTLGTEMKAVTSAYDKNDKSVAALTDRNRVLNKLIGDQDAKVKILKNRLDEAKTKYGENSEEVVKLQQDLNLATAALNKSERQLKDNNTALDAVKTGFNEAGKKVDEFGKEVEEAERKSSRFAEIFKAAFWADLASRALTTVISKVKEFASSSIQAADKFGTLAEIYGLTSDRIQELEFAGIRLDVSLETITGSMTKLVRNMNTARAGSKLQVEAFRALDIEITNTDGSLRDANTVFGEAIDALGAVGNETERDAIAMQLFGKSAMEMNPLIKAGSAELAALSEKAHEMGAVMSEDAVNALDNLDETLQEIKMSAQAFVGEALAAIIGDGKTAADVMNDLQDSLANTSNTQKLIDRFHRLNAELSSGALSAEEAKKKNAELEQVKQDLIAASGGVVTAFDIENGTFEQQIGVLEELTRAERDYLKSKLTTQILDNSGESELRKLTTATKSYNYWQNQANISQEKLNKLKEDAAKGESVTKAALNSASESLAYFQEKAASASTSVTEARESAAKAESGLRALIDNGLMTAAEACETFALTSEELAAVLAETGDTSESSIPQVQALKDSIDLLNAEYEEAKATVAATLESIVGGWQAVPPAVALSAEELTANLQSQLDYMLSYRENLDALVSRKVPGVDMSALTASLSDGSMESAQILAGLKTATDEELAIISQLLQQKGQDFKTFTEEVGAEKINLDARMAEIVDSAAKTVTEDMDLSNEAKASALNTINGYINGVRSQSGALNLTMTRAAQDALNAWKKVFKEASPSRAMMESGENAIKGAVIGVENEQGKLVSLYTTMGEKLLTGLSKGMKDSSGKVMQTADDITKELAKRVGDIVNVFSTSADISELQYKLWEMTADGATAKEKNEKQAESLNKQADIQRSKIDSVSSAYKKMVELTGENSDESLKLQKQLLQEQIELEKLKDALVELSKAKESAYNADNLSKMAEQEFKLWSLQNQSASDGEKLAKQAELLALKYEMQGENVSEAEAALADMVKQYGANSAESVKLQEQLLKEKIAYMELKAQIDEVNRARGYVGGSNIGASGFMQAADIWAGLNNQKINTDISGMNSLTRQDVGGMIAGAVNAMGTMAGNGAGGDLVIEIPIDGKTFYRATMKDFRAVEASSPKVRSDKL